MDRLSGHRGVSQHSVPETEEFVPDGFCLSLSLFNNSDRVRNLRNYAWIVSCLYFTVILELVLKVMLLGAASLITSLNTVAKGSKRAEGKCSAPGSAADFCQLLSDQGRQVSEISPFLSFFLGPAEARRAADPAGIEHLKGSGLAEGQPGRQPGK